MPTRPDQRAYQLRSRSFEERPLLAFMSDLGTSDDSVGICKGLMLTICPDANIVDICHSMTPFDIEQGARLIVDLPRYYPSRTVFATTSYPDTGTEMRSVALRLPSGHVYVAPNNGLLTRVIDDYGYVEARAVTSTEIIPEEPEPTFFSREMVAVPSAHLAAGFPFAEVGAVLSEDDIVKLPQILGTRTEGRCFKGIITNVDMPYGNVWTSIRADLLEAASVGYEQPLRITVDEALTFELELTRTFGDVPLHRPVAYLNSRGFLSLARNRTDLANTYNLRRGMPVEVAVVD